MKVVSENSETDIARTMYAFGRAVATYARERRQQLDPLAWRAQCGDQHRQGAGRLMRFLAAVAAILILGGCHSGSAGAAGISGGVSLLGIINQDWLAEQGAAVGLKINPPTPTPASDVTTAGAQ